MSRGADFVFHRVVDGLVDDYFPLLDILDRETESIEDQFVDGEPEREAMARKTYLTRDDILRENKKLEVNLKGLKA